MKPLPITSFERKNLAFESDESVEFDPYKSYFLVANSRGDDFCKRRQVVAQVGEQQNRMLRYPRLRELIANTALSAKLNSILTYSKT
jgi:hypothetical protein